MSEPQTQVFNPETDGEEVSGNPCAKQKPHATPVDAYFADWKGPSRPEFRDDIEISRYTENQKWQMWCLERFLNELA